ncbi:MAG: hypothetical protein HKN11_16230 [Rhizobiales bacterium]|nr:hypothetical protein [Hyphomicrobiales bacterium]
MYLLAGEDGHGTVCADGSIKFAVDYHFDVWLRVGGFKTTRGWIAAGHTALQGLIPAAQVYLEAEDGRRWRIEVTEVSGNRAEVRFTA